MEKNDKLYSDIKNCIIETINETNKIISNSTDSSTNYKLMSLKRLFITEDRTYIVEIARFMGDAFKIAFSFTINIGDTYELIEDDLSREYLREGHYYFRDYEMYRNIRISINDMLLRYKRKENNTILLEKYLERLTVTDALYHRILAPSNCNFHYDLLKEISIDGYNCSITFYSGVKANYEYNDGCPVCDITFNGSSEKPLDTLASIDHLKVNCLIDKCGNKLKELIDYNDNFIGDEYYLCSIVEDYIEHYCCSYDELQEHAYTLDEAVVSDTGITITLFHGNGVTEFNEDFYCSITIRTDKDGIEVCFESESEQANLSHGEYKFLDRFFDDVTTFVKEYLSYIPEDDLKKGLARR